jgi:hypothetical protein
MVSKVRVKRRTTGTSGAPSTLAGGELAVDETTTIPSLYYGKGDNGSGSATSIVKINNPALSNLTDASISSPSTGQTLKYNGTAWENTLLDVVGTVVTGTWQATAIGVAYGGTGLASGTSGGVPYFSATTTMASSGALADGGVVLGGGAGEAPATNANLFYDGTTLCIGSTVAASGTSLEIWGFASNLFADDLLPPLYIFGRARGDSSAFEYVARGDICGSLLYTAYYPLDAEDALNSVGNEGVQVEYFSEPNEIVHSIKFLNLNNLDGASVVREQKVIQKELTDNTAKNLVRLIMLNERHGACIIEYSVNVQNEAAGPTNESQTETGMVSVAATRSNGGVIDVTVTKFGDSQNLTAGTLDVTFDWNGDSPYIDVTSNSSLSDIIYHRISYTIKNLGNETITVPA